MCSSDAPDAQSVYFSSDSTVCLHIMDKLLFVKITLIKLQQLLRSPKLLFFFSDFYRTLKKQVVEKSLK